MSALPPPPEESLNWRRDESIDLPIPESEGRLAIRHQDWRRLKTRIQCVENRGANLPIIYSILFGVSGSAGLSIIPLQATKDLPAWVVPLYVCIFIFSLICGLVFVFVERGLKSTRRTDKEAIIDEMVEIEGTFTRKKGGDAALDSKTGEPITNPVTPETEAGEQE